MLLVQRRIEGEDSIVVPPGEVLAISSQIRTEGLSGPYRKQLVFDTDAKDSRYSKVVLTVQADVQPILEATPSQLHFGSMKPGEEGRRTFVVRSMFSDLAEKTQGVETADGHLKARIIDRKPGVVTCEVVVDKESPSGFFASDVVVRLGYENHPRLVVPVSGRRVGDLAVTPSAVILNDLSRRTFRVIVRSRSKIPFRVKSLETPAAVKPLSWDSAGARESHVLEFTVDPERLTASNFAIGVATDREGEGIVNISVIVPGVGE